MVNRADICYGCVVRTKPKGRCTLFTMRKITQDMRFKQVVIAYSFGHGVTRAAIRDKTTGQNICRWCRKYDGTIHSLTAPSLYSAVT